MLLHYTSFGLKTIDCNLFRDQRSNITKSYKVSSQIGEVVNGSQRSVNHCVFCRVSQWPFDFCVLQLYLGSINSYIFFVVIDIFNLYCCRTVWSTDAKIPAVRKR